MGGANVKIFDYSDLADYVVLHQGGQAARAEQTITDLRDSGRLNLDGGNSPLLSQEVLTMLSEMRVSACNSLREALNLLSEIDSFLLLNRCRPTLLTATLDDVITTLAQSGIKMKPSDWAVVCMLCDECGKHLTPTQLITALKKNRLTSAMPIASRQSLSQAYMAYPRSSHFPNWPQTKGKEVQYYQLATLIKPLIDVLSLD